MKNRKMNISNINAVKVKHTLKFTDAVSTSVVPRHSSISQLEQLSPPRRLQEEFGDHIRVSPAKSADSETHVDVYTSFEDLRSRINADVRTIVDECKAELRKELDTKLAANIKMQEDTIQLISKDVLIRNIQDWSLMRMRRALKMDDDTLFETVIDRFIADYNFYGISKNDILSLKNSQDRRTANEMFHINLDTTPSEKIESWWMFMKQSLSEELVRYERLMKFGMSKLPIEKKRK